MKLWDLSGYSEKSNIQETYLPKTTISGQIVVLSSFDEIHVLYLNSHIFGTGVCFIAIQEGVYLG